MDLQEMMTHATGQIKLTKGKEGKVYAELRFMGGRINLFIGKDSPDVEDGEKGTAVLEVCQGAKGPYLKLKEFQIAASVQF